MTKKTQVLPVLVVAGTVIFVVGSGLLTWWSLIVESRLNQQISQLRATQADLLSDLRRDWSVSGVHFETRAIATYPALVCTQQGLVPECRRFSREVRATFPVAEESADPATAEAIDAARSRLQLAIAPIEDRISTKLALEEPLGIRKWWVQVVVSLVLMAAALWIILRDTYPPATEKWAFGCLGAILGFWLG